MRRVDNNIIRVPDTTFGIVDNLDGVIATYCFKWSFNTSLSQSANGKLYLEVSPDVSPRTWTIVSIIEAGKEVSLGVTVGEIDVDGKILSGVIPAGYVARIRTEGTIPLYVKGQEAVL